MKESIPADPCMVKCKSHQEVKRLCWVLSGAGDSQLVAACATGLLSAAVRKISSTVLSPSCLLVRLLSLWLPSAHCYTEKRSDSSQLRGPGSSHSYSGPLWTGQGLQWSIFTIWLYLLTQHRDKFKYPAYGHSWGFGSPRAGEARHERFRVTHFQLIMII